MKRSKKTLSFILCMALIAAMALSAAGCNGGMGDDAVSSMGTQAGVWTEDSVLGMGSTEFVLTVVDKEGSEIQLEIHTDKDTVGEALVELGVIAGDKGAYGLYVETVNGITVDYNKDGAYWAFYVNDEYAQSGVDHTKITEGDSYSFRVE